MKFDKTMIRSVVECKIDVDSEAIRMLTGVATTTPERWKAKCNSIDVRDVRVKSRVVRDVVL